MKKSIAVILALVIALILCACGHEHTWVEATCTEPKTCSECKETEGEPLGHTWVEATCTEPKKCSVCGEIEGKPLGHTWVEATCTEPKKCSVCGETEGEPLGHTWVDATCTEPQTCSVCGAVSGDALGHQAELVSCTEDTVCSRCGETIAKATGHDWAEATAAKPKTCKNCGLTEGDPLGYVYFPMNSYKYVDAYNRSKHKLGTLKKDSNSMEIAGTNVTVILFFMDASESSGGSMWAIPKMDFNELKVRMIIYGKETYDSNGQAAMSLIGQSFAEILDPTFDAEAFMQYGIVSYKGSEFTLMYSNNGFEYIMEGYPSGIGSFREYTYNFTISLSANKD